MSASVVPVILSGGSGTRLWPLSRALYPKQFLPLAGEATLLEATLRRLSAIPQAAAPIVVCNEAHRFLVREQLRGVGVTPAAIVLEPHARGTAAAIAAAAIEILARPEGREAIALILPVDHVIRDLRRFADAVRNAVTAAASGRLVLFGVPPAHPETGYGYLRAGPLTGVGDGAREVERFVEKPDAETAAAYVQEGGYYWNSGMFVFPVAQYLEELSALAPGVHRAAVAAHRNALMDLGFLRLEAEAFAASPTASVDRALMERTRSAVMVPLDAGWSDIGSWSALSALGEPDEAGNVVHGDVLLEGTRNTCIHGAERLVAALGVRDLVIADTADALLVADRNAAQDVRRVVAALASAGREEHRSHRRVHRPWGTFEVLHGGDGFKVKRIVVNPGQRLSMQSHRHRSEHWVAVRGTARVTRGEETFAMMANQSTYIPPRTRHRLENPGDEPIEIIEVQTGAYLGEDDIVRYDDDHGRASPDDSRSG